MTGFKGFWACARGAQFGLVLTGLLSVSAFAQAQTGPTTPAAPGTPSVAPAPTEPATPGDTAAPNPPLPAPSTETATPTPQDQLLGDEQAIVEERQGREEFRDSSNPHEDNDSTYFFVGLFYRQLIIPEFMWNLFMERSVTISNPGFGAEFTYRKNGFDIVTSLWYQGLSGRGAFQQSGDPITDTEIQDSSLGVLFAAASFLWSTDFNDMVSLQYGADIGVGVTLGKLVRTEAWRDSDNSWHACESPGSPAVDSDGHPLDVGYCDGPPVGDGEEGAHYNVVAKKWSDGGKVPNILPWLGLPHIALRVKPIKQLMFRIDAGFGLGFFFGAAANYGF